MYIYILCNRSSRSDWSKLAPTMLRQKILIVIKAIILWVQNMEHSHQALKSKGAMEIEKT